MNNSVNNIIATEARRLMKEEKINERLFNAAYRLDSDMNKLAELAARVEDRMLQIKARLRDADFYKPLDGRFYIGLNSCGELQSLGVELDMQVALTQRSVDDFNAARRGY